MILSKEAIAVSSTLRVAIEKAGLKHIVFAETVTKGRQAQSFQGQWCELTSDLTLPPLSERCRLEPWQNFGVANRPGSRQINKSLLTRSPRLTFAAKPGML